MYQKCLWISFYFKLRHYLSTSPTFARWNGLVVHAKHCRVFTKGNLFCDLQAVCILILWSSNARLTFSASSFSSSSFLFRSSSVSSSSSLLLSGVPLLRVSSSLESVLSVDMFTVDSHNANAARLTSATPQNSRRLRERARLSHRNNRHNW